MKAGMFMLQERVRSSIGESAVLVTALLLSAAGVFGQLPEDTQRQQPAPIVGQKAPSGYVLGPNDVIAIHAPDLGEASDRPMSIGDDGYITLPQMGKIRAAGVTVSQLEEAIVDRLKPFVRSPQVTIRIMQFRAELVFLIGAFTRPGTYPYQPNRKLSELLSIAGGLAPSANRKVKVTRQLEFGRIPTPGAVEYRDRGVSEVEIDVRRLMDNIGSPQDLVLQPSDVVAATLREKIYVSGMVTRPGVLELEDRDSLSVSQAVSLAGMSPEAAIEKAVILRPVEDTNRRARIPVNLKKILAGEASDFPLLPNDVLVIPQKKSWGTRVFAYALPAAGIASTLLYILLR
jgi:polysaccharide biosynthesis/export protein